jgi:preprotein translocase subunit YajC
MDLLSVILTAGQQGKGGSGMSSIIMLIAIIAIFYFFMIRPQTKKQKEEKAFREQLQKGQDVVTIGGVHGKIKEIKESTIILEIAHEVTIEIEKSAIVMNTVPSAKK